MVENRRIYEYPYQRVYSAALSAAERCGFRIDEEDEDEGIIQASAGMSLWSWGEYITIEISRVTTGIEVTLSSNAKIQVFDWDKSKDNVNAFFQMLGRHLEE